MYDEEDFNQQQSSSQGQARFEEEVSYYDDEDEGLTH